MCSNVPEAVYMQHLMGVDGVIVDLVQEIAEAVSEFAAVVAPEPSPEEGQAGAGSPRVCSGSEAICRRASYSRASRG